MPRLSADDYAIDHQALTLHRTLEAVASAVQNAGINIARSIEDTQAQQRRPFFMLMAHLTVYNNGEQWIAEFGGESQYRNGCLKVGADTLAKLADAFDEAWHG